MADERGEAGHVLVADMAHPGTERTLYSFETGLTHGTVNTAAKWVVAQSRISQATYARNDAMTHIDPLVAQPEKNTLLSTVTPFLTRLGNR